MVAETEPLGTWYQHIPDVVVPSSVHPGPIYLDALLYGPPAPSRCGTKANATDWRESMRDGWGTKLRGDYHLTPDSPEARNLKPLVFTTYGGMHPDSINVLGDIAVRVVRRAEAWSERAERRARLMARRWMAVLAVTVVKANAAQIRAAAGARSEGLDATPLWQEEPHPWEVADRLLGDMRG